MIEPNFYAAIVMTILWPTALAYCTLKYVEALRRGAKLETWFWLFAWCAIVSMVEWFVWFALSLVWYVNAAIKY